MLYTPQFLAIAIANLFTMSSFGGLFLLPLFISYHGGSKLQIGIIMGAMPLASVFSRPWISEMIDRVGRKRSYTIGTVIMSLIPFTCLMFQGDLSEFYFQFLLIRVVHGIGLAFCLTAAFTYVADIIPDSRMNEGIGMFGVSGLTGLAIGPVIAELTIEQFGFSTFFISGSALAIIGLILHLPISESYVNISQKSAPSFFSVLKEKRILTVALLSFLFGFGLAASGSFVSPFAEARQLTFISLYFIAYSSAAVFSRLFGGRFSDRVGEKRIIPYALVMTGTGLLLMMFLQGSTILVLSGFLTGFGHGFLYPSLNTLAVRNADAPMRGKITGAFTGSIDGGVFMGSVLLGYVGEFAGYRALFFTAGSAVLFALVLFQCRRKTF
ncbi:MAG: MFS transporter [Desulfobacterales bacterium]|nr:MFS transporter [Desulfobacterales bacterium]